jgi:hypothetical protein
LTSLVELEVMRMGVTGKLDLWTALRRTPLAERRDFDALIERAQRSTARPRRGPHPSCHSARRSSSTDALTSVQLVAKDLRVVEPRCRASRC